MAKELEKLNKVFAPLKKSVQTLIESVASVGTNFGHLSSMQGEVKDEVTRRVGELRKAGRTGTKLTDFSDDKELKAVLIESERIGKQMLALVKQSKDVLADGKKASASLTALQEALDKTIVDRKKKKDRALLPIDSASLPDLEKLSTEVGECIQALKDDVLDILTAVPYEYDPKETERRLQAAVNASASVRAELDTAAMAKRGLDLRLLGKNLALSKRLHDETKSKLDEAAKLAKTGKKDKARDQLAEATESRSQLQTIAEQYARAIKGLNTYDKQAMVQSKDGQAVLDNSQAIADYDEAAGKALDKAVKTLKL